MCYMKLFRRLILSAAAFAIAALSASALSPDSYTEQSVLSSGKWVKISVEQSGMHFIPTSTLSEWGFKKPADVRIHGYGGAMLSDVLDPADYIDDLPEIPMEQTPAGLVFYAVGPVQTLADGDRLTHIVNPYDTKGYYFLTEKTEGSPLTPAESGHALEAGTVASTSALALLVHEQELTSPGGSGRLMVGEDFNSVKTRTFNFNLTGRDGKTDIILRTSFFARTPAVASKIIFHVNETALPSTTADIIQPTTSGDSYWGKTTISTRTLNDFQGEQLPVRITFECSGIVNKANLDYIEVTYSRRLDGSFDVFADYRDYRLGSADSNRRLWDVTDPRNPLKITFGSDGAWRSDYTGTRHYVSWSTTDAATMPRPKLVSRLAAQNLHGLTDIPDMVIIAPTPYLAAARDIAAIHRSNTADPLTVEVAELAPILNEFGSGAFDPGAIRRFLKMLYDRGNAVGTPLRYVLLMGKGTTDNRALTSMGRSVRHPMPLWVSEESLAENQSYSTDDYFALLDDFDGRRPQSDNLDVCVGRIPCATVGDAATAVDKIRRYIYSQPRDDWRTRLTVLVDDENDGIHMVQSDLMLDNLSKTAAGARFVVQKVYCDAYERQNSTYPQARRELFNYLADGTSIFAFIGHGSPTALGSKSIIQPTDFREQFHLRRLPFFYTATCNFLKWDYDITSMAEQLMFQSDGGIIGCFAALRPVFISNNGNLSASFGNALATLDTDRRELTFGELYRRAKNGVANDMNKLRYVLMGDPALRLSYPGPFISVKTINGADATDPEAQIELKARQSLEITGTVLDPDGNPASDFNGRVSATLYDAEHSVTTYGHGEGERHTFEQIGDKLLTLSAPVTDGHFTIKGRMPSSFSNNYRPATFSFYAAASDESDARHAMGMLRNVYAYGYDDNAEPDDEPPVIHSLYLNSDKFTSGSNVNESPMLIARISDNIGINVSTAGIGRQMSVIIDGKGQYADCARHFTLDAEPSFGAMSGTLAYPLSGLSAGSHELTLRVWDVADNFTEACVTFNVIPGMKPEIFSVYTDAMPARSSADFYVKHNRPEALMTVRITVYSLNGRPVWSSEVETRSNMDVSEPIRWDLKDSGGKRVDRGIYLYRAEISTDGETFTTASRKIAVAADGAE